MFVRMLINTAMIARDRKESNTKALRVQRVDNFPCLSTTLVWESVHEYKEQKMSPKTFSLID